MEFFNVVSPSEAQEIIKENFKINLKTEEVSLLDALGRKTAVKVTSREQVPGFHKSTVDGFAVQAADTFGSSESLPACLEVVGQVHMGHAFQDQLNPYQAVEIATGGMLPEGADAVVMIEHTETLGENSIAVNKSVAPGENIIKKGEDIEVDDQVIAANHALRAQDLGLLAAVGYTTVPVYELIRVGIVSTGDEIVPPEEAVKPGQVRDINTYTLAGSVQAAGGAANCYGIIEDDFDKLKNTILNSMEENHITLISGGSSVGTRDLTYRVLDELGDPGILFHGVSIKPGKPILAASYGEKLVFGLPGHPASALIGFQLLVEPLIKYGSYIEQIIPNERQIQAKITKSLASAPGRQDYIRVQLEKSSSGEWLANPILGKSGLISPMVRADGISVIPAMAEGIDAGAEITVILF